MLGDYNVDLERDGDKATSLLNWADQIGLAPYTPENNTSRRSNRIIDYLLATGIEVSVDTYDGLTTSDHKPLICSLSCVFNESNVCSKTL